MSNDFVDITITGLDIEKTRQSHKASGLREMVLTLSTWPTDAWVQIFKEERKFPRHTMWRRAWIEGNTIVIDCVPEELEEYHLKDLKEDVASANIKYIAYLKKEEAQNQRQLENKEQENRRLNELNKRLKF